ncbi:MAG: Pvc16 family protein [Planctomycetota bacterium]
MSTYLAIRGVTETLKSLLDSQMEMNGITVSSTPPDLEPETKEKRINLYLYKVVENAYLKNQEIPGEGHPAAYGHPPLSLVLYYLLTAFPDIDTYNKDYDLTVHEILADAMRVFHDYPILTDSMEIPPGSGTKLLHTSLQNQFEKGKITLEPLDTEELTKIWMGLTNPYRLSVGYAVSVVQIESQKPRRIARPVKTRRLHALQLLQPQINDLVVEPHLPPPPTPPEMPPATARIGDTLTIHGVNFVGVSEQLIIGDGKFSVTPTSDRVIVFVIPNDPKLQPGIVAVSVHVTRATEVIKGGFHSRGKLEIGENAVTSNQVPLMLAPQITNTNPPSGDSNTILTLEGMRLYKEDFKSYVLVGDTAIEVTEPPGSEWDSPIPTRVQVPLAALAGQSVGAYPIRIRVNGAESLEDDKTFELI